MQYFTDSMHRIKLIGLFVLALIYSQYKEYLCKKSLSLSKGDSRYWGDNRFILSIGHQSVSLLGHSINIRVVPKPYDYGYGYG